MKTQQRQANHASDWLPSDLLEQAYTLERRAFVRCRLALLKAGDRCLSSDRDESAESCRREAAAACDEWEGSVDALRRLAHLESRCGAPQSLASEAACDSKRRAIEREETAFRRLLQALAQLRDAPNEAALLYEATVADAQWKAALSDLEPDAPRH